MPDPITLPHPIRSEQERENLIAALNTARCSTVGIDHLGYFSPRAGDVIPPVEPLPELAWPWGLMGKDGEFLARDSKDHAVRSRTQTDKDWPGDAPHRVVRLAVVEVLDPEPEPPKAAPSGRRYIVASRGKFSPVTLTGDSGEVTVIDAGWDMISLPPCDLEHVAALLREAEHGK